jgi:hypothetical protein
MAVLFFSGFETGSIAEWTDNAVIAAVSTTGPRTGTYCLNRATDASTGYLGRASLNKTTIYVRAYVYFGGTTYTSGGTSTFLATYTNLNALLLNVRLISTSTSTLVLRLYNNATQIGSDVAVSADTWYRLEVRYTTGSGTGIMELKLDGSSVASASNLTLASALDKVRFGTVVGSLVGVTLRVDDVLFDDAAYPGAGQCIAKQGRSGVPNANDFTKSNASTIDTVWSDTPFSAATNAFSPGTAATEAQTMLIATTGIASGDTINACKFSSVAVRSGGTTRTFQMRRRVNASNTDTTKTLTTSDAYYEDGIWSTTTALIDSVEIGWVKSGGTGGMTLTVEDCWLMVDYNPAPLVFDGTLILGWIQDGF